MSASPSRWRAPVRTVIAATASRLATTGSAAPPSDERHGARPARRATPTTGNAAAPLAISSPGSDRQPGQQRERGRSVPPTAGDRRRTETAGRGDRDGHRQAAPTGRRTSAGSTPKTPRIWPASSVLGRRPVGDDPAGAHQRDPREEVGGQGQVVEDGDDRRPVALVEVDEQLHDLDLVADVEVRGRLVEDEDRGRLGEGDRDEHELPLAHRQASRVAVGKVTDADPLDRRIDGVLVHLARAR